MLQQLWFVFKLNASKLMTASVSLLFTHTFIPSRSLVEELMWRQSRSQNRDVCTYTATHLESTSCLMVLKNMSRWVSECIYSNLHVFKALAFYFFFKLCILCITFLIDNFRVFSKILK